MAISGRRKYFTEDKRKPKQTITRKTITAYIMGHYNPSVKIIDPVSHITYVVFVNFIHNCQDLQFKANFERQIFVRNFSRQFYLLAEFFPEICWGEIAKEIFLSSYFDSSVR